MNQSSVSGQGEAIASKTGAQPATSPVPDRRLDRLLLVLHEIGLEQQYAESNALTSDTAGPT
jgi:hypothetical protein